MCESPRLNQVWFWDIKLVSLDKKGMPLKNLSKTFSQNGTKETESIDLDLVIWDHWESHICPDMRQNRDKSW